MKLILPLILLLPGCAYFTEARLREQQRQQFLETLASETESARALVALRDDETVTYQGELKIRHRIGAEIPAGVEQLRYEMDVEEVWAILDPLHPTATPNRPRDPERQYPVEAYRYGENGRYYIDLQFLNNQLSEVRYGYSERIFGITF